MSIRLAVFDMAGTTVDDSADAVATSVCDALRAVGVDYPVAAIDEVMGMPKPLAIRHLLEESRGSVSDDEIARVHADFQKRMVDHYSTHTGIQECQGTTEAFAALQDMGVRVTLDTGFDRRITNAILERLGWRTGIEIDDSITSDEVENGRPYPDMIYALAERAGITDMAEVAKLGDSLSDIQQGIAAGCGLVAGVIGNRLNGIMDDYPQAVAVNSITEFVALVETHNASATELAN